MSAVIPGEIVSFSDQCRIARPRSHDVDIGADEVKWFTVTVSADTSWGTVSASPYGVIGASADFIAYNMSSFVIMPEEFMRISGSWVDGVSMDLVLSEGFTYTFDFLTASHEPGVTFTETILSGEDGADSSGGCNAMAVSGLGLFLLPILVLLKK